MAGNLVTFEVEGLDECLIGLEELGNYFGNKLVGQRAILPALREAGDVIKHAQQDMIAVDTGALRDTISATARRTNAGDKRSKYYRDETAAVFIGPRPRKLPAERKGQATEQQLALEFGTADMAARPFIRPSLELRGEGAMNVLRVRLKEEIDKLVNRINRQGRKRGKMLASQGLMS